MKKITLSNLINLTKEEILSIDPHDIDSINKLEIYIDSTYELVEIMDNLNENCNKKYNEDNFDFTLATKSFLNLINKGIQAYKKEIGYINLDSNDKIYLSSLFVNGFLWNKEVASTL